MQGLTTLITVAAIMGGVFILISSLSYLYSLRQIKNKTAGNGQHGTARWASKREIHKTYKTVPFEPQKWRENEKSRPTEQGIVVGCESKGNETAALVDSGDVHCMMIGAAGVGKTAYCLAADPDSRVACEVMATSGKIIVSGEISCELRPYIDSEVKKALQLCGYSPDDFLIFVNCHRQSRNIANGVSSSLEKRNGSEDRYSSLGAGDQGTVYGYATNETEEMLPLPLVLAHNICREIDIQKRKYRLRGVMPDGKAQVTVEYEDGKAKRIKTIVVSVQHSKKKPFEELENEIRNEVLPIALSVFPADEDTEILINPAGCFNIGGPEGDTGLTGRKIMVDTYGGLVAHGGGAFSGKDATKVDRSGAYMARYIAKNIVKAGLAERCQVGISYAIGKAEPIAVSVDSFGTSSITDEELAEIVTKVFDLRPAAIIDRLDLSMPIYKKTSAYGHFNSPDFPWEKTDAVPELMKVAI